MNILRKVKSLLPWKVDPIIYPLVLIVGSLEGVVAYTSLGKSKQQHDLEDSEENSHLNPKPSSQSIRNVNVDPKDLDKLEKTHSAHIDNK